MSARTVVFEYDEPSHPGARVTGHDPRSAALGGDFFDHLAGMVLRSQNIVSEVTVTYADECEPFVLRVVETY